MTVIRLASLFALLLATASAGCGTTRLMSRFAKDKDDDEPRIAQKHSENSLTAEALFGDEGGSPDAPQDLNKFDPGSPPSAGMSVTQILPVSEHMARATQAYHEQRFQQARQHLDAIFGQQPNHPDAHHLLAVISDLEGRPGDAEHHYRIALEVDPRNAKIIGDLGYSYMLQGRDSLAEQYLVQAKSLDPSQVDAVQNAANNLATLYSRHGDIPGAYQALTGAYPEPEVQRRLTQLFPGTPPQYLAALSQPAPDAVAQNPAIIAGPAGPASVSNPPDPYGSHPGTAPWNMAQQPAPADPQRYPGALPNAATGGLMNNAGGFATAPPPEYAQNPAAAMQPSRIAHASADAALAESVADSAAPTRRWPPSVWPAESSVVPAAGAEEQPPLPNVRPTTGVTYLMQRRTATRPPDVAPPGAPTIVPGPSAFDDVSGAAAHPELYRPQAQSEPGPGGSRIVAWPNINGQSIDPSPQPQAGAPMDNSGGAPPNVTPSLRTSPGTASGWNGGLYPPPQRQLPGASTAVEQYPPQGAPLYYGQANHPAGVALSAPAIPSPHPGFVIAPNSPPPTNPLAGYEEDRRRFDQQFQQQVDQTYAQSPAGYIPPPSSSMTRPDYQPPQWQPQTASGAPVGPGVTPWNGQAAGSPTRTPATSSQSFGPYRAPEVRPAETAPAGPQTSAPPYHYGQPQPPAASLYGNRPAIYPTP